MNRTDKYIQQKISKGERMFAWLIDPDKVPVEGIKDQLVLAQKSDIDFVFLGGSLLVKDQVDGYIDLIRRYLKQPIILFPGGVNQVNGRADGILLLSLISGRNPDFLIGRHVEVASILKQTGLDILPTGYILVESGQQTTASYISNTSPVPHHKNDIAVSTALAGELLGLKYIFLDGGSGAKMPVDAKMIKDVKKHISIPLIVGGGIKTPEKLAEAYQSGADIVVVGNVIEEDPDQLLKLSKVKNSLR